MAYLKNLKSTADLKSFSDDQLIQVASEVRERLIDAVSEVGGHFASNLGVVELTVVLHAVFDTPKDKLIWDVSHQCYPHKILTGRADQMNTIRQKGGLCGFTLPSESEYDTFIAGHSSTSISAAMGIATARDAQNEDYKVVAVIGDGAMAGGLCYEGMNHLGSTKKDVLIVLNDNCWAISKTVGALSKYLTNIMTDERYNKLRREVWEFTGKFKRRQKIREAAQRLERSFKSLVSVGSLFEDLGLRYFGPIDGNDIPLLRKTLLELKEIGGPKVLHVLTKKGKGFEPAEKDALKYYALPGFDRESGEIKKAPTTNPTYTKVFGDALAELGETNPNLHVITAAMPTGTGTITFGEKFPERFHDVGIAEQHGACFTAGMAVGGVKPLFAVYSSFLQRGFDQVIHDIALQDLPAIICLDRAGLVGADGPTHHGAFDISFLQAIPNMTIAAPKDGNELRSMLRYAIEDNQRGPVALRYPRAESPNEVQDGFADIEWGTWETLRQGERVCLLAVGTMVNNALIAAEQILRESGTQVTVVNARFVKPVDLNMLDKVAATYETIITIEENALMGGFGSTVCRLLNERSFSGKVLSLGIPDQFITHGTIPELWAEIGLDAESIAGRITVALDGSKNDGSKNEKRGLLSRLTFRRQNDSLELTSVSDIKNRSGS